MPISIFAALLLLLFKFIAFGVAQGYGPWRIKTQLLSAPGTALVLLGVILLLPKMRVVAFSTVNILLSFLLVANLWYLRFFHAPMTWDTFLQAGNARGLQGSVWALIRWTDLLFFVDLLPLMVFRRTIASKAEHWEGIYAPFRIGRKDVAALAILLGVALHTVAGVKESRFRARPYLDLGRDNAENIVKLTAPLFYLVDGKISLTEWLRGPPSESDLAPLRDWFVAKRKWETSLVPDSSAPMTGVYRDKNLVMIQLEAFESALINLRVGGHEVTPSLNRLVSRGLLFDGVRTQVAHGNTSDAELLSLTSFYPLRKGSAYFRYSHNRYRALPQLFRDRGYASVAFHGNRASFWSRSIVYPGLGFDRFVSEERLQPGRFIAMGIDDFSFFSQVFDSLEGLREPFFAFVISLSSHLPFVVPPELVEPEFNAALPQGQVGDYLRSIHYADAALGRFLNAINASSLSKNTVIFAYGDHEGPSMENRQALADLELRDRFVGNDRRIPVVLFASGLAPGVVARIGGTVDVMPTLAYLFGLSGPSVGMGTNLFLERPGFAIQPLGIGQAGLEYLQPKGPSPVAISEAILRDCRYEAYCGEQVEKGLK